MSPRSFQIRFPRKEFLLLAILCLGLFLRIYDLAGESMWLDETVSVRLAHKGVSAIVKNRAANIHPPLYFLLLRGWVALFGDSEFATRFLSVLFGAAAIFMMYKVGSLFFDQEVGILSSLLLAVSRFHIQYSQEARAYTLMALLTLLSIYFFKRFLEDGNRWVSMGYILSTAFLAYTHVFGLFIIAAENLYVAALLFPSRERFRPGLKKWVFLQLWVALLFAPWIPVLIKQVLRFQGGFRRPAPSLDTLFSTFGNFSGSEKLAVLFALFALLSLVRWRRREAESGGKGVFGGSECLRGRISLADAGQTHFLWLWLLVPVILPFFISHISSPIYKYRLMAGASLALYLLVARGIKNLAYGPAKLIVIVLLLGLSLTAVWRYYGEVRKEQWREAARYVEGRARAGDLVLFNASYARRPFNYYSKRTDLIKEPFPGGIQEDDQESTKELSQVLKGQERVWLVLSHTHGQGEASARALGKIYPQSSYRKFKGIEVYLFQRAGKGMTSRKQSFFDPDRRFSG